MVDKRANLNLNNAASISQSIIQNPVADKSASRYKYNESRYEQMLKEALLSTTNPYVSTAGSQSNHLDSIKVGCALILSRCGPKSQGFEEKQAEATGGACKSAVVNFWRKRGFDGDFVRNADGSFSGNPGRAPELTTIIKCLDRAQKENRCNISRRAYQQTHEDVRKIYFTHVLPNIKRAIKKDPSVDYASMQVAVINIMQFSSVSRGDEMLRLRITDLIFTGENLNSPIVGVLPITKNNRASNTYFQFKKMVDVSICGLSALQAWLCVLRAHEVANNYLFLKVASNRFQKDFPMRSSSYIDGLKKIGDELGIFGLAEHSARRGGAGYYYFVLRMDIYFMYRTFSWDSISELLRYIGLEDVHNSYALLGFTGFKTNELYFPAVKNV